MTEIRDEIKKELEEQRKILEKIERDLEKSKKDIDSIRRYMRRTFVSKLIYWGIIIVITAGAVYAAKPYVQKGIETYRSVRETLESSSEVIEKPASLFKDVEILKKIFELKSN